MPAINNNSSYGVTYNPNDTELLSIQAEGQALRLMGENLASSRENSSEFQPQKAGGSQGFWELFLTAITALTDLVDDITNLHLGNNGNPAGGGSQLSGQKRPPQWVYTPDQPKICFSDEILKECRILVKLLVKHRNKYRNKHRNKHTKLDEKYVSYGNRSVSINANLYLYGVTSDADVECLCAWHKPRRVEIVAYPGTVKVVKYYIPFSQASKCKLDSLYPACRDLWAGLAEFGFWLKDIETGCFCLPPSPAPFNVKFEIVPIKGLLIRSYDDWYDGIRPIKRIDNPSQTDNSTQLSDQSNLPEWLFKKDQPRACSSPKILKECKKIKKIDMDVGKKMVNAREILHGTAGYQALWCLCPPKDPNQVKVVPFHGILYVVKYPVQSPQPDECRAQDFLTRCANIWEGLTMTIYQPVSRSSGCVCPPPSPASCTVRYDMVPARNFTTNNLSIFRPRTESTLPEKISAFTATGVISGAEQNATLPGLLKEMPAFTVTP